MGTGMIADLIAGAFAGVAGIATSPIVFRDKDGNLSTGQAIVANTAGSSTDTFQDRNTIRSKTVSAVVLPAGLTFGPAPGMTATWAGATWNVLSAWPLRPTGDTVAQYRLVMQR